MTYRGIYQEVNPRQRVVFFGASLIQVGESHTEPLFFVALLKEDDVCQPVGIVHFSN